MKKGDAAAYARALEKAIRAKCLDCCGGMRGEVRRCEIRECALWAFRGAVPSARRAERTFPEGAPLELDGQIDISEIYREAVL